MGLSRCLAAGCRLPAASVQIITSTAYVELFVLAVLRCSLDWWGSSGSRGVSFGAWVPWVTRGLLDGWEMQWFWEMTRRAYSVLRPLYCTE